MKKMVLKLELHDGREKKKAMKAVSTYSGIDSISMDMKQKRLTVIGAADPITIVTKLRKYWPKTDIILVGPAKEPEKPCEKKEEAAKNDEAGKKEGAGQETKEEGKKEARDEAKKEEDSGGEDKKKKKKKDDEYDPVMELVRAYKAYNPQMPNYNYVQNMEESPSGCTII